MRPKAIAEAGNKFIKVAFQVFFANAVVGL